MLTPRTLSRQPWVSRFRWRRKAFRFAFSPSPWRRWASARRRTILVGIEFNGGDLVRRGDRVVGNAWRRTFGFAHTKRRTIRIRTTTPFCLSARFARTRLLPPSNFWGPCCTNSIFSRMGTPKMAVGEAGPELWRRTGETLRDLQGADCEQEQSARPPHSKRGPKSPTLSAAWRNQENMRPGAFDALGAVRRQLLTATRSPRDRMTRWHSPATRSAPFASVSTGAVRRFRRQGRAISVRRVSAQDRSSSAHYTCGV